VAKRFRKCDSLGGAKSGIPETGSFETLLVNYARIFVVIDRANNSRSQDALAWSASETIYKYKRRKRPSKPIYPQHNWQRPAYRYKSLIYFQEGERSIYSSLAPPRPAFSAASRVFLS
jgi:hypothetical protein